MNEVVSCTYVLVQLTYKTQILSDLDQALIKEEEGTGAEQQKKSDGDHLDSGNTKPKVGGSEKGSRPGGLESHR